MGAQRISRRAALARGGTVLGATALAHVLPRGWPGSGLLVPDVWGAVVLDPINPTPPFTHEGIGNCVTPGTVLAMNDGSANNVCNCFAPDPDAAQGGPDLDIVTTFQVRTDDVHAGDEIGVRFVIDEAVEKRVVAACFMKEGRRAIGLASGNIFTDQLSYPAFVLVDWKNVTSIRFRRTAAGAEIIEVNGIPPATRQFVDWPLLPAASRPTPSVEFGCPSPEAVVALDIRAYASERVGVVPGALNFTELRIRDVDSTDRLRFRADFKLGSGTNGIDPSAEPVTVKLSTPAGSSTRYRRTTSTRSPASTSRAIRRGAAGRSRPRSGPAPASSGSTSTRLRAAPGRSSSPTGTLPFPRSTTPWSTPRSSSATTC